MDKYFAKRKFRQVVPHQYLKHRFEDKAGQIIDEAEKQVVFELMLNNSSKMKIKSILDVACGPGRLSFYLEKKFTGSEIAGLDININMLAFARKEAQKIGSRVKFIKGDIYKLPFKDSSFDAVAGLRFFMHLPDKQKIFQELSRVVRKGGLVIYDIFNSNSILRIRNTNSPPNNNPFNSLDEMKNIASEYGLKLLELAGLLPFGETVYRRMPSQLLFLLKPFLRCPKPLASVATKLVLCFQK